jgi:hypothetical protein
MIDSRFVVDGTNVEYIEWIDGFSQIEGVSHGFS